MRFSGIYSVTAGLDPSGLLPSGLPVPRGFYFELDAPPPPSGLAFWAVFTVTVPPPNGFNGLKLEVGFEKADIFIGKLPFPEALGANGLLEAMFIFAPPPELV